MSTQWSRRLFTVVRRLVAWSRRPKVQRILAGTVVLLTGGFLFGALAAGWVQVRPHVAELDWRFALLGQVFAVAAYLLGSVVWYCVQRSFGIASSLRRSMVIHVTSSATKYIPGYGWHYMSKAYMSRETQARPRTLAGAMADRGRNPPRRGCTHCRAAGRHFRTRVGIGLEFAAVALDAHWVGGTRIDRRFDRLSTEGGPTFQRESGKKPRSFRRDRSCRR